VAKAGIEFRVFCLRSW